MQRLKRLVRGVLVTSTAVCVMSYGVAAQCGSGAAGSKTGSGADQHAGHGKSDQAGSSQASQGGNSGQLSTMDKQFVMKAAGGGLAEVQLGQLATEKAQNDEVKKFGQRMVDDHGKANDQLKQIAEQKGVTLPTEVPAKHKAAIDKMSKLSGARFDRAYIRHMVMDHKKDVAEFQKASKTCKDDDVKNFASQTLPTLQDHLKQAQQLAGSTGAQAGKVKKGSTSASANPQQ